MSNQTNKRGKNTNHGEEQDLSAIIKVLNANINAPTNSFLPNAALTKGEMTFLVEILEKPARILELIAQAEQDIHQGSQQIPPDDSITKMNRLTVLKNDIKELLNPAEASKFDVEVAE